MHGKLRALRMIPSAWKGDQAANLLALYWIALQDETVVKLAFFINPDGAPRARDYARLADRMVRSVQSGTRHLDSAGGVRALGEDLIVTLPPGYVARTQEGPDFVIYRLERIGMFGGAEARLGIYIGGFPKELPSGAKSRHRLFGALVDWSVTPVDSVEQPNTTRLETIQPLPNGREKMHVWLQSNDEGLLNELLAIAETLSAPAQSIDEPRTPPVVRAAAEASQTKVPTPWHRLAMTDKNAIGIALDSTHVYAGDIGGTVYAIPKTGGPRISIGQGTGWASSIVVDRDYVYWSGPFNDAIRRVAKSGGPASVLVAGPAGDSVEGLAVDERHIYWANHDTVWQADKAGGEPTVLVSAQPGATNLRAASGDLFWSNGAAGDIQRLKPSASNPETVVVTHQQDIVFAITNGFVYWIANHGSETGVIWRTPLSGGVSSRVGTPPPSSFFCALATDGRFLFWTSQGPAAIRKMAISGGASATVALDQPDPLNIAVDTSGIYWTNQHGDDSVMALPTR